MLTLARNEIERTHYYESPLLLVNHSDGRKLTVQHDVHVSKFGEQGNAC